MYIEPPVSGLSEKALLSIKKILEKNDGKYTESERATQKLGWPLTANQERAIALKRERELEDLGKSLRNAIVERDHLRFVCKEMERQKLERHEEIKRLGEANEDLRERIEKRRRNEEHLEECFKKQKLKEAGRIAQLTMLNKAQKRVLKERGQLMKERDGLLKELGLIQI